MFLSRLVVIGFFMVLTGAVLPFLMVIGILESTFFLNFIAFVTSTVGVFLGVIGAAIYVGENRKEDEDLSGF